MKSKVPYRKRFDPKPDYELHVPLDNSCQCIEAEDLYWNFSDFEGDLRDDIRWRPIDWLEKHYPELIFEFSKIKPKNKSFITRRDCGKKYISAEWRK